MVESAQTSASFVGREGELDSLRHRLENARGGRGGVVAVAAEPGLGKSRLCVELSNTARQLGFTALTGHCLDGGGGLPYLPFAEIVEGAAASLSSAELVSASAASAGVLALIAPGLRDALGDAVSLQTPSIDSGRHILFATLRDFLDRVSRITPLLLTVTTHGSPSIATSGTSDTLHRRRAAASFGRTLSSWRVRHPSGSPERMCYSHPMLNVGRVRRLDKRRGLWC